MEKKIIDRIISTLKNNGAKQVRSVKKNAVKPKTLGFKGSRKNYTPDVVAIYPNKKDLFAIENKINKSNISDLISKWILFGLEARKNGGKFYLVVPAKHIDYCQDIVDRKQLSANILPGLT